eukprot:1136988-Pelagomonas_calceolata.AAC.2
MGTYFYDAVKLLLEGYDWKGTSMSFLSSHHPGTELSGMPTFLDSSSATCQPMPQLHLHWITSINLGVRAHMHTYTITHTPHKTRHTSQ